ncbi:MAG: hypothetical protein JSU73_06910 [candidate division WOR-3 bacterium]|nr:MAG: hypothetical protein JSU73_06910 [candidate division WOR-3 bacterium]
MKRPTTAIFLACALAAAATVSGEMTFDREQLLLSELDRMTTVSLPGCVPAWEVGAPSVPIATAQLVVPQDMRVTGVTVDRFEAEVVEGEFDVYPTQQPRPLSDPGPFEYTPPDPQYYGAFEYPGSIAVNAHQGSMFGYNIASVFVAPVRYNADEKKLIFHPRVSFTLQLESADLGYLEVGNRSPESVRRIEDHLAALVLNPGDISTWAPGK